MAPRLKEVAAFVFGGFEFSPSASLSSNFLSEAHGAFHKEGGAFIAWYWNLPDLNPGNFGLVGVSLAGGFYAYETTPEGATAILNGVTTDLDLSVFGIYGGDVRLHDVQSVSEGAMIATVAGAEAAFSLLSSAISKAAINPAVSLAAAGLNAGLTSLWVHFTYGKPR